MAQPVFGYGSNSVRQLRGRLEDQRLVGYPARIRGQALAFCGPNRSWSEGSEVVGTATLIPSEEHTALGTVTFMSSEQIAMLDTYEGQDVPLRGWFNFLNCRSVLFSWHYYWSLRPLQVQKLHVQAFPMSTSRRSSKRRSSDPELSSCAPIRVAQEIEDGCRCTSWPTFELLCSCELPNSSRGAPRWALQVPRVRG